MTGLTGPFRGEDATQVDEKGTQRECAFVVISHAYDDQPANGPPAPPTKTSARLTGSFIRLLLRVRDSALLCLVVSRAAPVPPSRDARDRAANQQVGKNREHERRD